ncbi:hypothetical protein FHX75_111281 [Micromonospora palomenae]|uniref:Uncharacterized protein n=1 Tax=Micromonospora palomenae TaxID=1461247 RepID=A0A561WW88_9ACTN|nr:DUF6308 family protein [Micromonospora palomenae]TWG28130.1 hypothetical protein FHX75_111281 [Micromonospora palomenae]
MTTAVVIDVTAGFPGDVLPPVPIDDAANRILAYCTSQHSGWAVYDLAGIGARSAGLLDEVSTWSLLFANALNGRIELKQIADFDLMRRREFAHRISRIPAEQDLHHLPDDQLNAVIHACQFGFDGAWAPRITKLAALYRPRAIPVLDGYVGMAFGYQRDDLSLKVQRFGLNRQERISAIVRAMAAYLRDHPGTLAQLRAEVAATVPELAAEQPGQQRPLIADLRLLDMVVWTAMDDRLAINAGLPPRWLGRPLGAHIPYEAIAPVPITAPGRDQHRPPQVALQPSQTGGPRRRL